MTSDRSERGDRLPPVEVVESVGELPEDPAARHDEEVRRLQAEHAEAESPFSET